MTRPDLSALLKNRHTVSLFALLALTLVGLVIAYRLQYSTTLDLGTPGDSPFLTGFYADEPDIDYRYRWSKAHSEFTFPGIGSAKPYRVTIRVQPPKVPDATRPATITLSMNGSPLAYVPERPTSLGPLAGVPISVRPGLNTYEYSLPARTGADDISPPYVVSLDTGTYRPPVDPRDLGLKVDYIKVEQVEQEWNWPSLYVATWVLLTILAIYILLARLPILASLLPTAFIVVALDVSASLSPLYTAVYLPPVTIALVTVSMLVWQKARILRRLDIVNARARSLADSASITAPNYATIAMLVALVLFAALALWTIPQVVWIGHADYAENANVARNLIEGSELTVDYVAQFYQDRPGITHPADTWPLLQPLLIAPFFALFGPETWAARLPNLFILLALAWGVFAVGSWLWNGRVGLVAGLLTLLHAYFFNAILYPINDLAFTAIFFALVWLVWWTMDNGIQGTPHSALRTPHFLLVGLLAGLLVWSKPSGAVLLAGLALWVGWRWWRDRSAEDALSIEGKLRAFPWRGLLVVAGAFALVLVPLFARNLLAFGVPFYSTEGLDAWILRYWPSIEWENIYKHYVGSELPHPRWVVGGKFGYSNLFDAMGHHFRAVWDKGVMGGVSSSEFVIGPIALAGALLGMLVAPRRALRFASMALFSIGLYGLFVLLYWHFEGRYFQVAIPWLYLLLAGAVVWLSDIVGKVIRGIAGRIVSTLLMAVMAAGLLWPQVEAISNFLLYDTRPTSFTVAMDWLGGNSLQRDVVMTRDPWELNWHTRRRAVMIPFDDMDTIRRVAREYGVTMLQLGGPTDGIDVDACPPSADASSFPTGSRPALGKLYCGYELPGFSLVYKNGDLTIYRFSP